MEPAPFKYSGTVPLTPGIDWYAPPAGKTGKFYGVLENTSSDGTARDFGAARISNSGDDDSIYLQGNSGFGGSLQGLIFFVKDDFLNGYDSRPVALAELAGEMSIVQRAESGSFRFAVRNGGTWYLSGTARTDIGLFEFGAMGDESWGLWDPTGAPLAAIPATFGIAGSTLDDITALAFYATATRPNSAPSLTVNAYRIWAIIPEPASGLLLLLAAGTCRCCRRWRRTTGN